MKTNAHQALQQIRALLVNARGEWIVDVSGADFVDAVSGILTAHGIGGDQDEDLDRDGSKPNTDEYPHHYSVSATCVGTINELWTVRSRRALTRDELEDRFFGSHEHDDIRIDFESQETADEENRSITQIDVEAGELLEEDA